MKLDVTSDELLELISALRGRAIILADMQRRAAKKDRPALQPKRELVLALIAKAEQVK
jgi:hypothetical protein